MNDKKKAMTFKGELTNIINKHSIENKSNTPDFMLAKYLLECLRIYELPTNRRDDWMKLEGE